MRGLISIGLGAACAAALLRVTSPASTLNTLPLDGYAAMVNDRLISIGDVLALAQPAEAQLRDAYSGSALARKREEIYTASLDELIERALILEEFKKAGGTIPDRLINDRINEIIYDRFNNDRAALFEALTEQKMTLDEWRDDLRDRLIVNIMRRQEVTDKIKITPIMIQEAYHANIDRYKISPGVKLRMIVFKQGQTEEDREIKRQQAVLLRGRLLVGAEFADLARAVSEGSNAEQGGDMGWIEPSMLRPELQEAVAKLQPGQISEVIEAGNEYYILLVEDRREGGVTPLSKVRAEIEDQLRQSEGERLYKAWIERLKRKHAITRF